MRFFACYNLIAQKGFFVYRRFFFYTAGPDELFVQSYGLLPSRVLCQTTVVAFNLHASWFFVPSVLESLGHRSLPTLGLLLANLFPVHRSKVDPLRASFMRMRRAKSRRLFLLANGKSVNGQRRRNCRGASATNRRQYRKFMFWRGALS